MRVPIVLTAALLALVTSGCADPQPSATSTNAPSSAAIIYDEQGCQVVRADGLDHLGVYCVRPVEGTAGNRWEFTTRARSISPIFSQDYGPEAAGYDQRLWHSSQLWTRTPIGQATPFEVCWQPVGASTCQWASLRDYSALIDQRHRAGELDAEAAFRAKFNANGAREMHLWHHTAVELFVRQFEQLSISALTAKPACQWSGSGCAV